MEGIREEGREGERKGGREREREGGRKGGERKGGWWRDTEKAFTLVSNLHTSIYPPAVSTMQ